MSSRAVVVAVLVGLMTLAAVTNLTVISEQQFSYLAGSFLAGELHFVEMPGSWDDTVPFQGEHYWPLGPLPAVLLMPFVAAAGVLGTVFYQGDLQPFLVLGVVLLCFALARRLGYGRDDALVLALGFTFATAFLGVAMWPWSWYFSQVVAVLLLFAAILELAGRRRCWLLGILFGMLVLTRVTASLGIVWPLLAILFSREAAGRRLHQGAQLLLPYAAFVACLMLYNEARFGNPFEQGYALQNVPPYSKRALAYGILSPIHVPGNLYYLLLAPPAPVLRDGVSRVLAFPWVAANPWGMSILVTSPCLLYLVGLRFDDRTSRLVLVTCAVIAAPILLYYGIGYRQFGYRYALDFLPFLYFLLMRNRQQQRGDLSAGFRRLVVISALVNLYLFAGHYMRPFWSS